MKLNPVFSGVAAFCSFITQHVFLVIQNVYLLSSLLSQSPLIQMRKQTQIYTVQSLIYSYCVYKLTFNPTKCFHAQNTNILQGGQSSQPHAWALMTWPDIISLIPRMCHCTPNHTHRSVCVGLRVVKGQMFTFRDDALSRAWEPMWKLASVHTYPMPSVRLQFWGLVCLVLCFSPLPSSISYWCPKESRLEVSPSEVAGSNFISWIWKNTGLGGPSGRLYWKINKCACWEGAILL